MKPINLSIEGFLSYKEKSNLNFEDIDLACITGENGSGKSSILDAMTWALFGKSRSRGEAVINLQSEEAVVIFDFEYSGESYRAERRNPRGDTQSLVLSAGETDLTERTLRKTQAKLERILSIDYDTFVNAIFFLQGNSDQFVTATPGQRKQVLFEILNLSAWETYRKNTSKKIKEIDNDLMRLEGKMQDIELEEDSDEDIKKELVESKKKLKEAKDQIEEYTSKLTEKEEELEEYSEISSSVEALQQEISGLDDRIQTIEEKVSKYQKRKDKYEKIIDREDEIRQDTERLKEIEEELEQVEKASRRQHELESKLESLGKEIQDYKYSKQILPETLKELSKLEESLKDKKQTKKELEELKEERRDLKSQVDSYSRSLSEIDLLIEEMKDVEEGICPTCGQEVENPEEMIAELEEENRQLQSSMSKVEEKHLGIESELYEKQKALREYEGIEVELGSLQSELASLNETIDNYDPEELESVKEGLDSLDYDPEAREDLQRERKELSDAPMLMGRLEEAKKSYDDVVEIVKEEKESLSDKKQEAINKDEELNELMDQYDEDREEGLKRGIESLQDNLEYAEKVKSEANREIGRLEQILKRIEENKQRLKELKAEKKEANEYRQKLLVLREAFSKEGVPALLVEQSLPQIEDKANQLLTKLSDGTMQVRFVTQREYADSTRDDLKETLDIEIQDQSGVRDYEMYSGGESFRINFAIRVALSHILANRAGAKLRTLVIDEGFGSQDDSGRERLIEAIDAVRNEYNTVLVITHIREIMEQFPTQIRVRKTSSGSQINILE